MFSNHGTTTEWIAADPGSEFLAQVDGTLVFDLYLQGALFAGLLPILLPLAVSHTGNSATIGLVMPAFSLGGLTAPLG
ncbi:MAG: hypothetical protein ABFD05_05550 [Anaerolineaceae bacterium]